MNVLPDRELVDQTLNRICADKLFRRSHINERILRFLVDQAYEGKDVKEQVIGLALFEKDYSPEENNSKIRVSVYYLRKKLGQYYSESGREEEIQFEIKKGQYNLSFRNRADIDGITENSKSINVPIKVLYALGALLIAIFATFIVVSNVNQSNYCWTNFFASRSSNICIVSDHYISRDINRGPNQYSLSGDIKNDEDLIIHNKENPENKLLLSHFTLFSKMAPFAIQNLTDWFSNHEHTFTIRLESELRYEDYKENNLLFIGQAKNMVMSNSLFLQNSVQFKFIGDGFLSYVDEKEQLYKAKIEETKFKEYAMVSFVPLDDKRDALFFVSEHDIGVMATVRNFTDRAWLKAFYSEQLSDKKYFNALFEVKGVNRSDVVCRLVEMEVL